MFVKVGSVLTVEARIATALGLSFMCYQSIPKGLFATQNYIQCREKKITKMIHNLLKTMHFTMKMFFDLTILFFGALEIIVFAISFFLVL